MTDPISPTGRLRRYRPFDEQPARVNWRWDPSLDEAFASFTAEFARASIALRRSYAGPLTVAPTEEIPTVTTPTLEPKTTDAPPTVEPLRLTLGALRSLGACSPNLRTFGREFPESRFPTGVPLDEETCHRHWRTWDWDWARSVFLTDEGQREYFQVLNSETRETRERWGTGRAKSARVIGHLLATRPEYRSSQLREAARTSAELDDDRLLRALDRGRREVTVARQRVEEWTRALADAEARVPQLEEAARGAEARRAQRRLTEEENEVVQLERRLDAEREQLASRRAQLERRRAELAALTGVGETTAVAEVPPASEETPTLEVAGPPVSAFQLVIS